MSANESLFERPVVADTVVVNYFLAVGAFEFLRALLDGAVQIPRAVFDPDEPDDVAEEAASELRRGLRLHRQRSTDRGIGAELRERSARALPHFETLPALAARGQLVVLDLNRDELTTFARLRDASFVSQFSILAGLGRGEAAALAIALGRGFDLATDDQDAIKAAAGLASDMRTYRIRALLIHAVDNGLIARDEARALHAAMVSAGFWDRGRID
jgi:predicted nucleic acid-binding protein